MVSGITKYAVTVTDPNSIRYHLEKALTWRVMDDRDPFGSTFPRRPGGACVRQAWPDLIREKWKNKSPDTLKKVGEAIALFNAAQEPVILMGNGVRLWRSRGICASRIFWDSGADHLKAMDLCRKTILLHRPSRRGAARR